MSALAPPGAVIVEIIDSGQEVYLPPEEADLVAGSADKRRRDFSLGRAAARAALAELGAADAVIGKRATGAPRWPHGFVGSITHTRGFAAAIVGRVQRFGSLGIDAEHIGGVTPKLAPRLFTAAELAVLAGLSLAQWAQTATILFSAKEAAYKCWHPLTAKLLDFRDVEIALSGDGFMATQSSGAVLDGRVAIRDSIVMTTAWQDA